MGLFQRPTRRGWFKGWYSLEAKEDKQKSGWKTSRKTLTCGIYNLKMPQPAAKIEQYGDS